MAFSDGQVVTAAQLNDLANKDDLTTAVEAKVNEINGYDLSAASSAESAATSSATAQSSITLAQAAADQATATLSSVVKGANTFTAGATLNSVIEQINDGTNLYYWTGIFPKVVAAGSSPSDDGFGLGFWAVAGDAVIRADLSDAIGYHNIGQVSSYAALKLIVPSYAGQSVMLKSYNDGWAATLASPQGGDEFFAVNGSGTEDGGIVAVVNDDWYWRRYLKSYITPEMFGADGVGAVDCRAAIQSACDASESYGINKVRGEYTYLINDTVFIPEGLQSSPSGLEPTFGFDFYLNKVWANSEAWDAVPDQWWEATPAFAPKTVNENLNFEISSFDGGGKATIFSTKNKSSSTSKIDIGLARNYIIGYRNWGPVTSQGTMSYIHGKNWQDGYMGVLLGSGTGGANSECHNIDMNWCANNRFWGIGLQDRTQYSHVKAGTVDFNGKWMSRITLTNMSTNTGSEVEFGSAITNGTITRYAMSSVVNNQGTGVSGLGGYDLFIAELESVENGTSSFSVGDTITCGSWSATVSATDVTTDASPYKYYDILISNRSGDFSHATLMATYTGGLHGHNLHTNIAMTNNSTTTVEGGNFKGLGIATDSVTMAMYAKNLLGYLPFLAIRVDGATLNLPLVLGSQSVNGSTSYYDTVPGTVVDIAGFGGADTDLHPDIYEVFVSSQIAGIEGQAMITVSSTSIRISVQQVYGFTLAVSDDNPLMLTANTTGADAILTIHVTKR